MFQKSISFAAGTATTFAIMKYRETLFKKEIEKHKATLSSYTASRPRYHKSPHIIFDRYYTKLVRDSGYAGDYYDNVPIKIFKDIKDGKIQHNTLDLPNFSVFNKLSVASQFVDNELQDIIDPHKKMTFVPGSSFGNGTAKNLYFVVTRKNNEKSVSALIKYNPKSDKADVTLYPGCDRVPKEDIES